MRAYKILLLEQKFITHFEAYTTPELENYKTRASFRLYNYVDPEGIILSLWGFLLFFAVFSANIPGFETMLAMIVYLVLILFFFSILYVVADKKRKGIFLFELYCVEKVLEKRKLNQNKEKVHKEDNENIE